MKKTNSILSIIEQLLFMLLASIAFYITIPINVTTDTLKLPEGSVTNTVRHLQKEGYSLTDIDKYLLVAIGQPKKGELQIGKGSMNRIDFLYKLTTASGAIQVVTLIPGETRPIFLKLLAENNGFDYKKLDGNYSKYSNYKEAGILPNTYHVPKDINEERLIKFLVQESEKVYKKLANKYLKKYSKEEWLKYLTIASIIQKESANNQEMPIVASVIYNRLKIDMPLQMDGTLNYGKYSHVKVTPKRIKNDKSGFNTYANKGLPPHPVCSVSVEAIKASLNPEKSKYLYFMKNKQGVHDFTSTYREHVNNINRAR